MDSSSIEKRDSYSTPSPAQNATPPTLLRASRRTSLTWVGLLPTIFVITITAGLATLILVWIRVHQFTDDLSDYETGFTFAIRHGAFTLDEGSVFKRKVDDYVARMRVLTFSAIASHILPMTSTFLMGLVAYRTAAQWLHTSEGGNQPAHEYPTPLQFGILVRLLGNLSLPGVFNALKYAILKKNTRPQLPRLFLEPLVLGLMVTTLTHLVGVADLWLHTTAYTITQNVANTAVQDPSAKTELFGVAIDSKDTDGWGICTNWTKTAYPCLNYADGFATDSVSDTTDDLSIAKVGWSVAFNASSANTQKHLYNVITLHDSDDSAILVAQGGQQSTDQYVAQTVGAKAQCKIITSNCENDSSTGLTTSCAGAGYPQLPVVADPAVALNTNTTYYSLSSRLPSNDSPTNYTFPNRILGLVDGQLAGVKAGVADLPVNATTPSNPATILIQLHWSSPLIVLTSDSDPSFDVYDTYPLGSANHNLYAACNLSYFSASVAYYPEEGTYSIRSGTNESLPTNVTSVLWSPLLSQWGSDALMNEIVALAMIDAQDNVEARLNQAIGRMAIAFPAWLFSQEPVQSSYEGGWSLLAVYPVGPVFLQVSILYFYTILAAFIFISSRTASSYAILVPPPVTSQNGAPLNEKADVTAAALPTLPAIGPPPEEREALRLGQTWLTDPLPIIGAMFSPRYWDAGRASTAAGAVDMVYDSGEVRLEIGLSQREGDGATVFGLRQRNVLRTV